MCEYCDNDFLPTSIILSGEDAEYTGIYNSVYIEYGVLFSSIYAFGDDIDNSVKINYCPMCGKKLSAQEVEPCQTQTE